MTLAETIDAAAAELEGVERRVAGGATEFAVRGRLFAVIAGTTAEFALDDIVADAAVRTPDTAASARGRGWVTFTPPDMDRMATDRATAWLASAWRRAAG
ncbi:MAG: hypothetical protein ACJ77B_07595 [Chloroflexota bacterium]